MKKRNYSLHLFVQLLTKGPYGPHSARCPFQSYYEMLQTDSELAQKLSTEAQSASPDEAWSFLLPFPSPTPPAEAQSVPANEEWSRCQILQASDFLALKGFKDEVREHTFRMLEVLKDNKNSSVNNGENLWFLSLLLWEQSERAGKESIAEHLPLLFVMDFDFFIARTWIQRVLSYWYQKQERAMLNHLFWGTTKGKQGPKQTDLQNVICNSEVYAAVRQLQSAGKSRTQAEKLIAKKLQKSPSAIHSIVQRFNPDFPQLTKLLALPK